MTRKVCCAQCGVYKGKVAFRNGAGGICARCVSGAASFPLTTPKECARCHSIKTLADFYYQTNSADGHTHCCKQCEGHKQRRRLETPEGAIKTLVQRFRANTTGRGATPNGLLTFAAVWAEYQRKEGVDHWCPWIVLGTQLGTEFRVSLARARVDEPISDSNFIITSQEFTNSARVEWTVELIAELRSRIGRQFDMVAFERGMLPRPAHVGRGGLPPELLPYQQTPLPLFREMVHNRERDAANGDVQWHMTLSDLATVARRQNGMCHYWNVPLIFLRKAGAWQASLERIDNSKPYTLDNVCFIALAFQTACHRGKDRVQQGSQCQWSREKADMVKRGWGLLPAL